MSQKDEIQSDSKTVTLRSLLPRIRDFVELAIKDRFDGPDYCDTYMLNAGSGDNLLEKLRRSSVLDGETILGLSPDVSVAGECVRLTVTLHKPEKEEK